MRKTKLSIPFTKTKRWLAEILWLDSLQDILIYLAKETRINFSRQSMWLTKASVDKYFENLTQVLNFHDLEPQQFFNLVDSGMSCVYSLNKI